jgi:hypothetical protein
VGGSCGEELMGAILPKSTGNWHNESPYNKYMLIKMNKEQVTNIDGQKEDLT